MKRFFFAFLLVFASSSILVANEPSIWSVDTRADVLKGDARGVSIDDTGTITLAPKLSEVYKTEQPYIWSSAVDASGNIYLGTGGDGKIFKVDTAGKGALFVDLNEMNVSALAIGPGGDIFAATSPDGKVYRISNIGKSEVYFEPKEKYIWALAALADGSLAVGTGDAGKLYKVKSAGATPEGSLLFDSSETHIISLAADKQGNLYAGSDSSGIVYRFSTDGKPFALLDSPLREIHDLAVGPDGSVYALALGDSASAAKPAEGAAPAPAAESKTVSVEKPNPQTPEPAAKSRYDLTGAKSAVYRIAPDGGSDIIWASATVTGFSLHAHQTGNGILVGTSDKGRIYNITNDGRETLALQTGASQISTLIAAGTSILATSSNQGSLYRIGSETAVEGSYDSAVLDAKSTASWGRIWWRSNGNVAIQTRSGNTEKPDETWSDWSSAMAEPRGGQVASPKSRYFQWRATLKTSAGTALSEVNVSFVARNIAPEVLSIQVLPTNVGLAANPPIQVDPNIELSGMDPVTFGIPNAVVPPRRVYQRAATSLQWTAEDRNGDKLVYDVYYKEVGDAAFKLLRGDLNDNFLAIDSQSLADGRYIFKVVARDSPSNPVPLSLAGERITGPVAIDNTAPVVTVAGTPQFSGDKVRVVFEATDAASYLTRAEYSVNGGQWMPIYADDGISDGPTERYTVEIPAKSPGEYAVTIRVYDVNANSGNARSAVKR
jgi:sugar lactone lactonase YvrE